MSFSLTQKYSKKLATLGLGRMQRISHFVSGKGSLSASHPRCAYKVGSSGPTAVYAEEEQRGLAGRLIPSRWKYTQHGCCEGQVVLHLRAGSLGLRHAPGCHLTLCESVDTGRTHRGTSGRRGRTIWNGKAMCSHSCMMMRSTTSRTTRVPCCTGPVESTAA